MYNEKKQHVYACESDFMILFVCAVRESVLLSWRNILFRLLITINVHSSQYSIYTIRLKTTITFCAFSAGEKFFCFRLIRSGRLLLLVGRMYNASYNAFVIHLYIKSVYWIDSEGTTCVSMASPKHKLVFIERFLCLARLRHVTISYPFASTWTTTGSNQSLSTVHRDKLIFQLLCSLAASIPVHRK